MVHPKDLDMSRCWIVLPTYCEVENLPLLIEAIDTYVPGINVLVVDDNSTDGTGDVASSIAERRPGLQVIRRPAKTGLGDAYMEGFRAAMAKGAEFVVTMDGDLSHSPKTIPTMFESMGDAGCVVGSRYVEGGLIEDWTIDRRVLSWAANRFVSLLFGMPVRDCTSGFRLYRREVIESMLEHKTISQGYSFIVEILMIAAKGNHRIVEVPIRFLERVAGESKMGMHEILGGAKSLLSLRFRGGHSRNETKATDDHERMGADPA